jgi:hypothetical protein
MAITFKKFISESINDRGLFKAIFVIGLPGAGKSYTVSKLKGTASPMIVNTDRASEFLSRRNGTKITKDTWSHFQDKTHKMTKASLENYINGMLPLFVDGTSNDVSKILHRMGILESIGYDIGVVFVHASLETAKRRAKEREEKIGRSVDEDFIEHVHFQNKENAGFLKSKVSFFKEVENDVDGINDEVLTAAFKAVQSFFLAPHQNPIGKRAIAEVLACNDKYLVPCAITKEELHEKLEGWYK